MPPRTPIDEVLRFLGIEDPGFLEALRREGLFEEDTLEPEAAEELRVAARLVQELGVNPAGVEVVLHLRRRLLVLESRTRESLRRVIDEGDPELIVSLREDGFHARGKGFPPALGSQQGILMKSRTYEIVPSGHECCEWNRP